MPKDLTLQLIYEVKHLVGDHDYNALARIRELLELGALPTRIILGESASNIVKVNNSDGRYNAILEEFDKYSKSREQDSVDEGMHLTKEEIES